MTATIHYFTLQDEQRREEKLGWFRSTKLRDIDFQRVYPDAKGTWINQADNDFESLLPLVDKEVKAGKSGEAILTNYSLGIATNRDEWVYDLNSPLTLPRQGGGDLSASDTTRGDLSEPDITREDIFHYVYAVLHNPAYRKKYELNLKRDFPRIPFYDDFRQWAAWGKTLMELHLNYETMELYPLERIEAAIEPVGAIHELPIEYASKAKKGQQSLPVDYVQENKTAYGKVPKAKLKADKETGRIILDEQTTIAGIPSIAWEYKLGNRSALEWVLDQYKEKKPSDPTIAEKFNTYRFADYKEHVVELLARVCTVSVRTMEIVREMRS